MSIPKEWKPYDAPSQSLREGLEREIKQLARIVCIDDKPAAFRVLPCTGAFKDEANRRYGFVYQLPSHVSYIPKEGLLPGDISQRRRPVTLLSLLTRGPIPDLDLGARFALAKRLIQSILVLHAAGWMHKK
jgi:hypothetical protein